MHLYDFRETQLYLCPNCGHECTYKMPELMAQHAEEKKFKPKKECEKCNFPVPASRKVKRWRFIIVQLKQLTEVQDELRLHLWLIVQGKTQR
jgi:DNA replicative helicase MCM subunit Mcm2 (Cdc46/Mcm family)